MAGAPENAFDLSTEDPESVAEILCIGPFHVQTGPLCTLTFTHTRAQPSALFAQSAAKPVNVIRARVVIGHDGLIEMRDLLNRLLPESQKAPTVPPTSGTGAKPN